MSELSWYKVSVKTNAPDMFGGTGYFQAPSGLSKDELEEDVLDVAKEAGVNRFIVPGGYVNNFTELSLDKDESIKDRMNSQVSPDLALKNNGEIIRV